MDADVARVSHGEHGGHGGEGGAHAKTQRCEGGDLDRGTQGFFGRGSD
jgi:hypothetical protein